MLKGFATGTKKSYDKNVDSWPLGVILYQMIYGKFPFGIKNYKKGDNPIELLYKEIQTKIIEDIFLPEVRISHNLKDLFIGIFQRENERGKGWGISMINQTPWVTEGRVKLNKIN